MGHDHAQASRPAERRAPRVAPAAPVVAPLPAAVQLQRRLGNDGAQRWLARAQRAATVSSPHDAAELEAHAVARRVVRTPDASIAPAPAAATAAANHSIQRAPLAASAPPATGVPLPAQVGGGAPLPGPVRAFMEPRFGASFADVRIHTGEQAARLSTQLDAQAFTVGQHVFFGKDQYRPDSEAGRELIAHELTHTVQQGAALQSGVVQRSAAVTIVERAGPQVQRSLLGLPNPREYFAGKARAIPGFTMLTVVIGLNPITNVRVERNAGNILRGAIELIPGGSLITDALNAHGVFERASVWTAQRFDALKDIGASLWQDIESFLAGFGATDLLDPGALWDRARAIVERPIARILALAIALKDGIVALVKDAILRPLADFARTTRGYPLLCAVMGKDPITGEPVAQDAESLLGAFMKFIGEDEIWAHMRKANAIPRAFAWFRNAMGALRGFVNEIPGQFVQAFHALQVADIILIPRAFGKLVAVFGGFAMRFVSWGATAAWNLLEIVFDVVSPGAFGYIRKTGAALKGILKNPLPFVGNLVKAAKLGFTNFADHFLEHLKAGLIGWLTGALPGVYIPKAFSLVEIARFTLSVLGLTWANIRAKLVKATSENVVKTLETGAEIVIALVRDGPAAAWDKIKEQLSNLKDMVIGGITDFVVDMVVKKAIPKLISMFVPGAGFISAILSIYDTIMVFVDKIRQMVQVVTGFIDSIVAIAAGAIGAAATRVETALAGVLSLAINFLAGFAGLGKVADKVMGVFEKLRAPFDKALDWLVNFIVKGATTLIAKATGKGGDKPDERTGPQKEADVVAAQAEAQKLLAESESVDVVHAALPLIKSKYRLTAIRLEKTNDDYDVVVTVNPTRTTKKKHFDPSKLVPGDVVLGLYKDYRWTDPDKERWVPGTVTSIDAAARRFRWASANLSVPRTGVFDFADVDKQWKKGHVSQKTIPEDDLLVLNQDESKWTSFDIARAVLNYRHHQSQVNPSGTQWEHIIERHARGSNRSDNLALTASTINNRLGVLFGQPYASHEGPPGMAGTNGLPLRQYLQGKPASTAYAWKEYFYGTLSVSLKWQSSVRGKWQELN